jgi:hypothetical protein
MECTTMARGEVTGKKTQTTGSGPASYTIRGPPAAAYTIREFCVAHRLSVSMYFKPKNQGLGPREMAVGSRRYVSFEAAAQWRREREAAAAAAA